MELEFGNAGFRGERKTRVPGEKPLGTKERTNTKLNPHLALTPGFECGPHWWEASALTTVPSLSPLFYREFFKDNSKFHIERGGCGHLDQTLYLPMARSFLPSPHPGWSFKICIPLNHEWHTSIQLRQTWLTDF